MEGSIYKDNTDRYAKCIEISKRVRWDIDKDVIRGRDFNFSQKFLPDGLSKVDGFDFLYEDEKKLLSRIQGRTYANMFGFVERFITAKILETTRNHWLDDQIALEALIRFCDEELKHQELFRRIETMMTKGMPAGYKFMADPNEVAKAVLQNSTWAVLALIFEIELFTQEHYKKSIEPDDSLSELYRDIFLFHWKEETTHAIMDELEWPMEDARISPEQRNEAVDELIGLVGDMDKILRAQSEADVDYFAGLCGGRFDRGRTEGLKEGLLKAYRWQYIFSGVGNPRFKKLLEKLTDEAQLTRINGALSTLS